MKNIKYVQLEPGAFLLDLDFQAMNAEERGVYCTLIFLLYCNRGRCLLETQSLQLLCGCENFEAVWEKLKKKFQLRGGYIRHKRVSAELRKAKKYSQMQRQKALKRAASLPPGQSRGFAKKSKRNEIEENKKRYSNSNATDFCSVSSSSPRLRALDFYDALAAIIRPRTQSDRTSFRNIGNWLSAGWQAGRFNEKIFGRVLDYAKEAAEASGNHAAIFTALLKKELEYKK